MNDRWIPLSYQDYVLDQIAECDEQAMLTQVPDTFYNVVRPPLWLTETVYVSGDLVHPPTANGKIYECTVGGTSGSGEPGWGTTQDQEFTDGTVTWKTHDNFAVVNTSRTPEEFTISDNADPAGRKLTLSDKMGVITHTAGIVSHCALICHTDRSLRYVTPAVTTLGAEEAAAGRTTIFYALNIVVSNPKAL